MMITTPKSHSVILGCLNRFIGLDDTLNARPEWRQANNARYVTEGVERMFHYVSFQFGLMFNGRHPFNTKTPAKFPPNDPSSATRPTRRVDCNLDAMAGFAAALVRRQIS